MAETSTIPAIRPAVPLVERHRGWLARVIAARTGSRQAIDDVMQEVAVAVARSKSPPEADDDARPWLCMIAIRQCALAIRSAARRSRLVSRAAEHGQVAQDHDRLGADPIFWLLAGERREIVRRVVGSLDAAERQLLEWKYVDGITYPELADRLGVPKHVVEYRVVVAKRTLRGLLIEHGLGEEDVP